MRLGRGWWLDQWEFGEGEVEDASLDAGDGDVVELIWGDPEAVGCFEPVWGVGGWLCWVDLEVKCSVRGFVCDGGDFSADGREVECGGEFGAFPGAVLPFCGGRLVHAGPHALGWSAFDEDSMVLIGDERDDGVDGLFWFAGFGSWDVGGAVLGVGDAGVGDGAGVAARVGGCADGGAEFDERFVELAGVVGLVDEVFCPGPCGGFCLFGAEWEVDAFESEEDSLDVAVDRGGVVVVDHAGDGPCGVASDAWECAEGVCAFGECALVVFDGCFGGGVEEFGAPVVAKAAPHSEDVCFVGGCEVGCCWESFEEWFEAFCDAGSLGLLEHEFGDERGVGVLFAVLWLSPGEVASVVVEPCDEVGGGVDRRAVGRAHARWSVSVCSMSRLSFGQEMSGDLLTVSQLFMRRSPTTPSIANRAFASGSSAASWGVR